MADKTVRYTPESRRQMVPSSKRQSIRGAILFAVFVRAASLSEQVSAADDVLEEVVVVGERERQRQPPVGPAVVNPNKVTASRSGTTVDVRIELFEAQREVIFQQTSVARMPAKDLRAPMVLRGESLSSGGGPRFRVAALNIIADVDEDDGLPALIPFGEGTSLINVDYLRVRSADAITLVTLENAIHLQTRRCMPSLGIVADDMTFPIHFTLLGDSLRDCETKLKSREGDLLFSDGVPERLRNELRDIYEPISSFYSTRLGSEPGLLFVVWRPESTRQGFLLKPSWNRSNVLVLNGSGWGSGIGTTLREALSEIFEVEQIERRLQWQARKNSFTQSAVDYLLLLSRAQRDETTAQRLSDAVPEWIATCARARALTARSSDSTKGTYLYNCGALVQFIYDAFERSRSGGARTIFNTWRELLGASARRGEYGVIPEVFLSSSREAQGVIRGLLDGSVDWSQLIAALERADVRILVTTTLSGPVVSVAPLKYFSQRSP